jgi:mono/diheme cytochrome c family protein
MRHIKTIISASAIFIIVCIANPMKAQDAQKEAEKSKPVPAAVIAILEKNCIGCHSDDGSALAKMHFNFTKWDEYSAEEQTSTGQDILKIVTKGKMPPKKFLKNNPEAKLTDAEKTTICNWAGQL